MRKLYKSSDYAGLRLKNGTHFYYGYERVQCKHGKDKEDDDCEHEWCFVVSDKNEKELWRCGAKTLERTFPNTFDGDEPPEAYLLAGIGLYLEIKS